MSKEARKAARLMALIAPPGGTGQSRHRNPRSMLAIHAIRHKRRASGDTAGPLRYNPIIRPDERPGSGFDPTAKVPDEGLGGLRVDLRGNCLMRVLITGGAGFIGSHLADAYLGRGDEVFVLDDLSTGSIDNIRHLRG